MWILSIALAADPFFVGCWTSEPEAHPHQETWLHHHGKFVGVAAGGTKKHAYTEFLSLHETPDGWQYIARPSGQPITTFKAMRTDPTVWRFENLAHDFPKRIVYRLLSPNRLAIRVENNASKGFLLSMIRCGTTP